MNTLTNINPWILLTVAGLFEICWAVGLKYSQGFTKPLPSVLTAVALAISMYFLAKASEGLPLGTAYAVWVGIGALGTGFLGVLLFNEPVSAMRILFLSLLIVSIIGLKLNS